MRCTVLSETASATGIESEAIGAGIGFSGSLARLWLTYDPTVGGPETAIVKLWSVERTTHGLPETDEREMGIYRDLAPDVPRPSPRLTSRTPAAVSG